MIPSEIITFGDMCHAYKELFIELKDRGVTAFADAAIYSYVLTYQMYLNSMEEVVFEQCVDSRLLESPEKYCKKQIAKRLNLSLWTSDSQQKACVEAKDIIKNKCQTDNGSKTEECYPCANTIAHIFSKYERYLVAVMESTFKIISER